MARLLILLFAALLTLLAASPATALPAAAADTVPGAENRAPASLSAAPTHTRTNAAESPCTPPGSIARTAEIAAGCCVAAKAAPDPPNRIYSARELRRRAAEPGPYHNFPESFNDEIFERGTRTVTPGFFKKPRGNLSNDSVQYRLRGEINNRPGTYEVFARPSQSGRTEVIQHRFFRPDPR